MNKFRFSGAREVSNTRTITNQVGPDVLGVATKRSFPAFSDANTIYVAKAGSDANAGTNAAPKRTLADACYTAYASARQNVVVKDSGTYTEAFQAFGRDIYAAANQRPVLQMPDSPARYFDGIHQTGPSTYEVATPSIAAANYYSANEYSMTGVDGGVNFTGEVYEIVKFQGLYFMLSSNGLWWSQTGLAGWKLIAGTAGVLYQYYVISQNRLFVMNSTTGDIEEITVSQNDPNYVSRSIAWSTGLTGTSAILNGDDTFICVSHSSGASMTFMSVVNGVLETNSFTALCGTLSNAYVGAVKTKASSGFMVLNFVPDPPDGTQVVLYFIVPPPLDGSTPSSLFSFTELIPTTAYTNIYARSKTLISDENSVYLVIGIDASSRLYKITLPDDRTLTNAGITYYTGPAAIDAGKVFKDTNNPQSQRVYISYLNGSLYYTDNIGSVSPTYTLDTIQFTATTSFQSSAVAYLSGTPIGNITMFNQFRPNTVTNKQAPFLVVPRAIVSGVRRLNGFTLDGKQTATTGVHPFSTIVDGVCYIEWCDLKNCLDSAIFDRQQNGQRTYIRNNTISGCGVGVKVLDQGGGLPRLYNTVIKNCQYGFLNESYFGTHHGPAIYQCAIFDNSVAGVWVELVGQQVSTVDPVVSQISQSIIWNNGIDLYIDSQYLRASSSDYIQATFLRLYSIPATKVITSIYQYDPLLLPNGDYQDTYGGYAFDSQAVFVVAGPYTYSRSRTSTDTIDYTFDYLPVTIKTEWKASNFTAAEDGQGNYIESWDGMKRTINLSWDANSMSTKTELNKYLDMIRKEDAVFKYGQTTDGTDWVNLLSVAPGLEESNEDVNLVTRSNHPVCAKNEWVGYWIEVYDTVSDGLIYLRINANTAGDGLTPVTFTVDHPGVYFFILPDTTFKIVYLAVKIDKSQQFGVSRYGYVQTPDTGYSLTLREVDRYE